MKTRRKLDCVDLQDRDALAVYELTRGMTRAEQLAFWAERTRSLREQQKKIRSQRRGSDLNGGTVHPS